MSPKTLVLHIGMNKTGSTSIQESLANYNDKGSAYLQVPHGGANHSLIYNTLFRDNPRTYYRHARSKRDAFYIDNLQKKFTTDIESFLTTASAQTIISSGEDITRLSQSELKRLKRYFNGHFLKIQIFGYVRPPVSFMSSALQQRIRSINS